MSGQARFWMVVGLAVIYALLRVWWRPKPSAAPLRKRKDLKNKGVQDD